MDADFRAFYRFPADPTAPGIAEGNFGNLSAKRFCRMAERVFAFQGAMAARAMAAQQKRQDPAPTNPAQSSKPDQGGKRHITLHQMMLLDPTLIEYSKVG